MLTLQELQKSKNIATLLDKQQLLKIGEQVTRGCTIDENSRRVWKETTDKALEIAKQIMEEKNFPWPNASNIKFPLISQASIDYASRTFPEIIQNDKVVKPGVIGNDTPDQAKYRRATRVSTFSSYQLIVKSEDWVDGVASLLQVLPVLGTVFKKTYYSEVERRIISELCVPDKVVVNYNTKSLDSARRITQILELYDTDIIERQRSGIFVDKDGDGDPIDIDTLKSDAASEGDEDLAIEFYEQCCYLDLDEDGYKEPYTVTVHKDSNQVFRIVSRFKEIQKGKDGKIKRIIPEQYYTDFHFIHSPDGGFYSMGFGSLLLPLNKSINTLFNQLIDAGTLNNTPGGLIGRGLRMKSGQLKFKMGEWQVLESAIGDDIAKNIYPWPTKEPSQTLYNLLNMLIQIGRDFSSTTDVLMGKQPAQNVASGTVSQLVEQGTKVFIAINKRLYRSLRKEYQKIYRLNHFFLDQEEYMRVLDDPEADVKKDFALDDLDIIPVADPTVSTETQRIIRANVVQQLRTADPREADILMLQAMQLDKSVIDRILPPIDPNAPPPPDVQLTMAEIEKLRAEVARISADATLAAEKNSIEKEKLISSLKEAEARIEEGAARTWKMQQDALHNLRKDSMQKDKIQAEYGLDSAKLSHTMDMEQSDILIKAKQAMKEDKDDGKDK